MLVRDDSRGAIVIGQPSHAWISGQLARCWGNERFGAVEPFEEVCLAAEQHDIGMAMWDLELSPTGSPGRLRLDPWPLRDDMLTVHCEGQRLTATYNDDAAMHAALAAAPWETLEFELVPG